MNRSKLIWIVLVMLVPLVAQAQRGRGGVAALERIAGNKAISNAASSRSSGLSQINQTNRIIDNALRMTAVNQGRSVRQDAAAFQGTNRGQLSVGQGSSPRNVSAVTNTGSVQAVTRAQTEQLISPEIFYNVPAPQLPKKKRKSTNSVNNRTQQEAKAVTLLKEVNLAKEEDRLTEFHTGIGKSVLLAPSLQQNEKGEFFNGGYSVTVIKTNYKGKEEIFGVIATHVLPMDDLHDDISLKPSFEVSVKLADGTETLLPAKVVQVSPQSMLDITLVKFNPKDEHLFRPLEISNKISVEGEALFGYGYGIGIARLILNRILQKNSLISMRTNVIDISEEERMGFCGSPILDMNGQVRAIHTGTKDGSSYGTHARFINNLVQAYYENGESMYDLILDGHVLTKLNVDEYIPAFVVLDENSNILFKEYGRHAMQKFSESKLRAAMALPHASTLVLYSQRTMWDEIGGNTFLSEERGPVFFQGGLREHLYDIKNQNLLYSTDVTQPNFLQAEDFMY